MASKTAPNSCKTEDNVSFSQVTAVATEWMRDFLFVSLCRSFKDGNLDEFTRILSTLEAISENLPQNEKIFICAFLARVMHGKQLDVMFEKDKKVTPLMCAAKIWSDLKSTVEDESLVKNMTILLFVQSVAVCLENGSSASYVIQWLEKNLEFPQPLRVKLGTVVAQKDNYHPFLMSFSYSRLLKTVQVYLDGYLAKNPSDYLLKAATKAVQSSGGDDGDHFKVTETTEDSTSQTEDEQTNKVKKENKENTFSMRPKRKLLSTLTGDIWDMEHISHVSVCLTRTPKKKILRDDEKEDEKDTCIKKKKARSKWTYEQDKLLIEGVRRHGFGHWARILQDFEFEGRTSVMLKDRWRILKKSYKV